MAETAARRDTVALNVEYSERQKMILDAFKESGENVDTQTRIMVLLATENYFRLADDLANTLSNYPGMPSSDEVKKLICELEQDHQITKEIKTLDDESLNYYGMTQDDLEVYVQSLPDSVQLFFKDCRKHIEESLCARSLGRVSSGDNSGYNHWSFLDYIREAQYEVLLPMLNTVASEIIVKLLKKKAKAGVKVKILLPDYRRIVQKLGPDKKNEPKEWIENLGLVENVEIRIFSDMEDASIYSSLIVDRKKCRIAVFDTDKQVSSAGTLLDVAKPDYSINLTNMMVERFYDIWDRARPYKRSKAVHCLRKRPVWMSLLLLMSLVASLVAGAGTLLQSIMLGTALVLCGMLIAFVYQDVVRPILKKKQLGKIVRWI